jgi:hypothetical protein
MDFGFLKENNMTCISRYKKALSSNKLLTTPLQVRLANPLNKIRHFLIASMSWNFIPPALKLSLPSVFDIMVSGDPTQKIKKLRYSEVRTSN